MMMVLKIYMDVLQIAKQQDQDGIALEAHQFQHQFVLLFVVISLLLAMNSVKMEMQYQMMDALQFAKTKQDLIAMALSLIFVHRFAEMAKL